MITSRALPVLSTQHGRTSGSSDQMRPFSSITLPTWLGPQAKFAEEHSNRGLTGSTRTAMLRGTGRRSVGIGGSSLGTSDEDWTPGTAEHGFDGLGARAWSGPAVHFARSTSIPRATSTTSRSATVHATAEPGVVRRRTGHLASDPPSGHPSGGARI